MKEEFGQKLKHAEQVNNYLLTIIGACSSVLLSFLNKKVGKKVTVYLKKG